MRLLSILNITNIDDINSDSGYIFNYLLAEQFDRNGHIFNVILPEQMKNTDIRFTKTIYYASLGVTKYEARYSFDWNCLKNIIIRDQPDFIFVNECELTLPIKALLITYQLTNIKIIAYCHYPALHISSCNEIIIDNSLNDAGLGYCIVSDILQSVNISDYFIIQSQFAKELLVSASQNMAIPLEKEIYIVPPPHDPLLFIQERATGNKIIYNHRLYESYGVVELLSLVERLSDISFLITNPMMNRSIDRYFSSTIPETYASLLKIKNNVTLVDGSESRLKYKDYLRDGFLSIAAYRPACVWSMAAIDCIGMNMPVVAPNFAAYKEFIPSILRYNNFEEEISLINKLQNDSSFYMKCLVQSRKVLRLLTPEKIYKTIVSIIGEE